MWFDLGQMERMDAVRVSSDLLFNLPFKRTAVAATDKDGIKFSLWLIEGEQSLTIAGFTLMDGNVRYINPLSVLIHDGRLHYFAKGQEIPESEAKSFVRMTLACLLKIQSTDKVYQPSVQQTLINAKRKRKGKRPLISWHTVTIGRPSEKREHQGGTHASPRLHDRRGHWRTYASGKKGWVKACKVGDASSGIVFKDYKVQPTSQTSQ